MPRDDEEGRKELVDDRYKLSGSFSSAPLATPGVSRNRRVDAEMSQLRQRTAVPPGQGIRLVLFSLIMCLLFVC